MIRYLLDTDHVSLVQRRHLMVLARLERVGVENVAIAIITVEEQLRGWLNVIRQQSKGSPEKQAWAYANLDQAVNFLHRYQRLNFSVVAAKQFYNYRQEGIRIGTQDLRIACIALTNNLPVVTRNRRDFNQVPGLKIEDWSVEESD